MTRDAIVCPLCPLHCDDIAASDLAQGNIGCRLADSRMHAITQSLASALSAASDASVREECREWIKTAKRIVISGEVIDWETARAISDFMAATGAEVDELGGDGAYADAFSREGAFLTTLGELAARDISLLVIGDPSLDWPRIETKLASIKHRVDWSASSHLPQQLASLRRKLLQSSLDAEEVVLRAYDLIQGSQYLAVVVAPSAIRAGVPLPLQNQLVWSTLIGMIRELNRTKRAVLLGFDRSLTVRSVLASHGHSTTVQMPFNEDAVRIHFSPYGESFPNKALRTIVIGAKPSLGAEHSKWLPASVPGIHHPGMVIRGDGSVTLPLQSVLPPSTFATPAQQLRSLMG